MSPSFASIFLSSSSPLSFYSSFPNPSSTSLSNRLPCRTQRASLVRAHESRGYRASEAVEALPRRAAASLGQVGGRNPPPLQPHAPLARNLRHCRRGRLGVRQRRLPSPRRRAVMATEDLEELFGRLFEGDGAAGDELVPSPGGGRLRKERRMMEE